LIHGTANCQRIWYDIPKEALKNKEILEKLLHKPKGI
jgi:hypothetical protein